MKALLAILILCSTSFGFALSAHGQAFRGLGVLSSDDPTPYSQAHDVSGDGTTVVGESEGKPVRWRVTVSLLPEILGFLPGGSTGYAKGVSGNGSVIVGTGDSSEGKRAFRWTSITGAVSLGTLDGAVISHAEDCSADGSVVIGRSYNPIAERGFRWTQATGLVQLDTLPVPGKAAEAYAVSGDGMVAVGRSGCCGGDESAVEAVRWPGGGVIAEGLGDLQQTPAPWSASAGISADGLVVVGGGTRAGGFGAFRWSGGVMTELLPPLPPSLAQSCAMDASADGSVIVGTAGDGMGESVVGTPINSVFDARAFIWTAGLAMTDLRDLLVAYGLGPDLQGWRLEIATGVSDDGNIITGFGTHDGRREAWVVALNGDPFADEPSGEIGPDHYWGHLFFGLREHHGFVWHPSTGPRPILPDPPPFLLGPAADGGARWVESAHAPRATEQLWAVRSIAASGDTDLRLLRYDGRGWSADWTSRGPASLSSSRGFDLVYEDHSGDALAVYESGLGTPHYRTYSRGTWSEERALPSAGGSRTAASLHEGLVRWIELAARPGTDEIALVYADDGGNLLAWTWSGNHWLSESAVLLAVDVASSVGPRRVSARPFDAGYESVSGSLLVAWTARGQEGFVYARRQGGAWSKPQRELAPGPGVEFVDLASEPASNLVAGLFVSREAHTLSMWSSDRWESTTGRRRDDSLAGLPGAVGWAGAGRIAVGVYAGESEETLNWSRWMADTGWTAQPDIAVSGKGFTRSVRLIGSTRGGPFLSMSDSLASLYAFHYDDAGTWRVVGPTPFVRDLASSEAVPFGLGLSREGVLVVGDPDVRCRQSQLDTREPTELLSFGLSPRGVANRVDGLTFPLENVTGINRSDWSNITLVVESENGKTATVAGRGYADPLGRLVFFGSFDVSAPARYVLKAQLPALDRASVTVSLPSTGPVTPRGVTAGDARRDLSGEAPRPCEPMPR